MSGVPNQQARHQLNSPPSHPHSSPLHTPSNTEQGLAKCRLPGRARDAALLMGDAASYLREVMVREGQPIGRGQEMVKGDGKGWPWQAWGCPYT